MKRLAKWLSTPYSRSNLKSEHPVPKADTKNAAKFLRLLENPVEGELPITPLDHELFAERPILGVACFEFDRPRSNLRSRH